ncbi:hypothetical protein [Tumidithrix elongata]
MAQEQLTTTIVQVITDSQKSSMQVGDISEIKDDKTCADIGDILIYGETGNYVVYICSEKQNSLKPAYFKIKRKYASKIFAIEEEAYLGLKEDSIVGRSGNRSIKLTLPIAKSLESDIRPSLYIAFYGKFYDPSYSRESLTRYLSTKQLVEVQKLDFWKSTAESDPQYESIKRKLEKYVEAQKNEFGSCLGGRHIYINPAKFSEIYKVGDQKYLFAFFCGANTKNPLFSYFLLDTKDDRFEVKSLSLNDKYHLQDIYRQMPPGTPTYNSNTKTLSIHQRTRDCGSLYKYRLEDEELVLQEARESREICPDNRSAIDPVLYPLVYP